LRCPRCGNENPETNRFCGMCGATLLQEPAPTDAGPGQRASAPAAARSSGEGAAPIPPPSPQNAAPRTSLAEETPIISGPSFLGLDQPAASTRRRGNLSTDPRGGSSRNLDYLLQDDEDHPRGGFGKFIFILLALALAVGLGYMRWKNGGFSWLNAATKKPPAATETADGADSSTPTPALPPSAGTTTASPAPAGNAPAAATGSPPAPDSAASPASNSSNLPSGPASNQPAAGTAAPASNATTPGATTSAPAAASGDGGVPKSDANFAPPPPSPAAKDAAADATSAPAAGSETPKPAPLPKRSKPSPSIRPARASDPVAEAQKYIYGKGVRQDCDRGLRLLKPAADQANPKAMIEMGALYSAGLCTPRDLPTAYRWFAMALRKDPDNQSIQTDLKKLWGEMTQPERQLAIRLSQ
jgi:hypothetical protein